MFKIHRIDLNLKQYPNYYLSSINFNPADQFHTIITCSCYDKHLRYFKLEQARKIIEIQQNKIKICGTKVITDPRAAIKPSPKN